MEWGIFGHMSWWGLQAIICEVYIKPSYISGWHFLPPRTLVCKNMHKPHVYLIGIIWMKPLVCRSRLWRINPPCVDCCFQCNWMILCLWQEFLRIFLMLKITLMCEGLSRQIYLLLAQEYVWMRVVLHLSNMKDFEKKLLPGAGCSHLPTDPAANICDICEIFCRTVKQLGVD